MSHEKMIEEFDRLRPKAALIHPVTWCVKRQVAVPTLFLQGRVCCTCKEFVLNDGVCDPL